MSTSETSRFVRLRVDMLLEITDLAVLSGSALESIAAEYGEPGGAAAEERLLAEAAVREDGAEALASLIDPFDLVGEVPGVELAQASWTSEIVEHDPDATEDWDLDDDGDDDGDDDEEEDDDGDDDEEGEGDRGGADDEGAHGDVPHNGGNDGGHDADGDGAGRRV
ncbi:MULTISPECIES: hypothetical protein [unclassified Streptomyces]|uniref:hypothetical protein n=1 Tax=unclassified Streptomyces TaxID=2593676 RepID=UPI0036EE55DC